VHTRLLVIQHEEECPPAWLGEWLEAAEVDIHVVRGHRGDAVPHSATGYDGLLVLGGDMGAYDDAECPWLGPTKELIARTVAAASPFLGVCLGHQLAAVALGGSVGRNPAGPATGLTPVTLTAAGRADVLLGVVEPGQLAVQWNRDIVTKLPDGATVLAQSPDATVQATRFGDGAWGVQFHPEVSPEVFAGWTGEASKAGGPDADGIDIPAVVAAVEAAGPALEAAWRPLGERFADVLLSARAQAATLSTA